MRTVLIVLNFVSLAEYRENWSGTAMKIAELLKISGYTYIL